ncbi:hypothetical protein CLOM_g23019 [Closterium sp. NIES-68]|nr:hypothetical protein CLOM_g23019 [Closterium sp. NIES-68]
MACPCCVRPVPALHVQTLLPEEFWQWEEAATSVALASFSRADEIVLCPGCHVLVEKLPAEAPADPETVAAAATAAAADAAAAVEAADAAAAEAAAAVAAAVAAAETAAAEAAEAAADAADAAEAAESVEAVAAAKAAAEAAAAAAAAEAAEAAAAEAEAEAAKSAAADLAAKGATAEAAAKAAAEAAAAAASTEERDEEGQLLTPEMILRCGQCGVVFCGSCREHPYHLGLSCAAYSVRLAAPKCRFCGERIDWERIEEAGEEEGDDNDDEGRRKREEAVRQLAELVAHPGNTIPRGSSSSGSSGNAHTWAWGEGEMRGLLAAVGADTAWCVSKADLAAVAGLAVCVCGEDQCRERLRGACTRVGPCGHACGGVSGELQCLPCLHDLCFEKLNAAAAAATAPSAAAAAAADASGGAAADASGAAAADASGAAAAEAADSSGAPSAIPLPLPHLASASDFCPICWVEPIAAAPAIRLSSCRHVVHAACAREKIRQSYPGPELSFGFLSCPLCPATTMDHPALQTELAAPLALKKQVKDLAVERVKAGEGGGGAEGIRGVDGAVNGNEEGENGGGDGRMGNGVLAGALRRFLFFLCSRCHRPYFGGDRRCGAGPAAAEPEDEVEEEREGGEGEEGRAEEGGGGNQGGNELVCGECLAAEAAERQREAAAAAAAGERERSKEQLWEAGKPCTSNHGQESVQFKCRFCCSIATFICGGSTHYCTPCHNGGNTPANSCMGGDGCPLRVAWHPKAPAEFCLGCALCRP